jgi:hypothetical protein
VANLVYDLPAEQIEGLPVPVNIVQDSSGGTGFTSTINNYAETLVPFDTETTILSYTVSAGQTLYITAVIGWGDTNGEFFVRVNTVQKGGGRNTAADPSFVGDYHTAPIIANAGDMVTISVHHFNTSTRTMKVNLLGGIK